MNAILELYVNLTQQYSVKHSSMALSGCLLICYHTQYYVTWWNACQTHSLNILCCSCKNKQTQQTCSGCWSTGTIQGNLIAITSSALNCLHAFTGFTTESPWRWWRWVIRVPVLPDTKPHVLPLWLHVVTTIFSNNCPSLVVFFISTPLQSMEFMVASIQRKFCRCFWFCSLWWLRRNY